MNATPLIPPSITFCWALSAQPQRPPADPAHLTPEMRDALEAAGEAWLTSVQLSGLAGWAYNAHWRRSVARLTAAGYLERGWRTKKLRRTDTGARRLAELEEGAG